MDKLESTMIEVFAIIHSNSVDCEKCPCEDECNQDNESYSDEACQTMITEYATQVARGLIAAKRLKQ